MDIETLTKFFMWCTDLEPGVINALVPDGGIRR